MKHKKIALLCTLLIGAGAIAGVATVRKTPTFAMADAPVCLDTDAADLFLPQSYEQYLPLVTPAAVAVRDDGVIAIADDTKLYTFDPVENRYYCHEHKENDEPVKIKQLQFTADGSLYFSSSGMLMFRYDLETHTETLLKNFPCVSFEFAGGNLYVVRQSGSGGTETNISFLAESEIKRNDFNGISVSTNIISGSETTNAVYLTSDGDFLYIAEGNSVSEYSAADGKFLKASALSNNLPSTNLTSIAVYNGHFYFTVSVEGNGELYRTRLNDAAEKLYSAPKRLLGLTNCGGALYCIHGNAVRRMTGSGDAFSEYEISSASASENRLNGATEIKRAGNIVATVDAGNQRVSLYDLSQKRFTLIPCEKTPEHVALDKDGTKIAVTMDNIIEVYDLKDGVATRSFTNSTTMLVKGVTFVYDKCYYVTERGYGYLDPERSAPYIYSFSGGITPETITNDIYGNLYVQSGSVVYSFTEENFSSDNLSAGTSKYVLAGVGTSLTADYLGNVWYLFEGKLYCNAKEEATINGASFVYHEDDMPVSFALSFEDGQVYFNYGDYVVRCHNDAIASLPALNKIESEDAKQNAFSLHEKDQLFTVIEAGAIGIRVNASSLREEDAAYFPYDGYYYRTEEPMRGVYLAQTQDYVLVATFDGNTRFTTSVFLKEFVTDDESDYWQDANETGYTANAVSLTYAPCTEPSLTIKRLDRGTKLTVLGYASGPDREYAYVEAESEARATLRGYVPRSYLTSTNPLGIDKKEYRVGYIKAGSNVTLLSEDGESMTVTEKTSALIYDNGDGTCNVKVEYNGKTYTGVISQDYISNGESDALRISLMIILSVLALVIIGAYVFLMFTKDRQRLE